MNKEEEPKITEEMQEQIDRQLDNDAFLIQDYTKSYTTSLLEQMFNGGDNSFTLAQNIKQGIYEAVTDFLDNNFDDIVAALAEKLTTEFKEITVNLEISSPKLKLSKARQKKISKITEPQEYAKNDLYEKFIKDTSKS